MRLAIIIPLLNKMAGNRLAIDIGKSLSIRGNDIQFFSEIASRISIENIKSAGIESSFHILKKSEKKYSGLSYLLRRLNNRKDRKLAALFLRNYEIQRFDALIVIANEGHHIAEKIKRRTDVTPVTALVMMELYEYIFLLDAGKKGKNVISKFRWLLPFLNKSEQKNIANFDLLLSNSDWTTTMVEKYYGKRPVMSIGSVDMNVFRPPGNIGKSDYIAVPTASLTDDDKQIVSRLQKEGFRIIAYGPRKVDVEGYLGFVEERKMREIVQNAVATLFLFDYEALGLIPLESLSSGTPVITYAKQGPYALLRNNPHVRFVSGYAEIKEACLEFMNAAKTVESAEKCRKSVEEFSVEKKAAELISLLESMVEKRK